MKIYVAGRWTRKPEVRAAQAALRAQGRFITHDWTEAEDPAPEWTEAQTRGYLADQARADIEGVMDADTVVLLHDDTGRGLFVELGAALAYEPKRVIVVGADLHDGACVFYFLPEVEHAPDVASALALLAAERAA
jgi:hypothetical protein